MTKFGVAGNSQSFLQEGYTETIDAAAWCASRGIDFFEYSFGRGILLREETAKEIGMAFQRAGMEMTVHAPYFINFANTSADMIEKSVGYITSSIKKANQLQAKRVIFHAAAQGKLTREEAVSITQNNLNLLRDKLIEDDNLNGIILCPETMGKNGQIGTVSEIISFCNTADFFYPCIDFGHVNAREQGILKNKLNYNTILHQMLNELPENKVKNMHIHFSKIEYGKMGEIRHLTFADSIYGPLFEPLAEALYENNLSPYVTCESAGTQAEDTIYMKKIMQAIEGK